MRADHRFKTCPLTDCIKRWVLYPGSRWTNTSSFGLGDKRWTFVAREWAIVFWRFIGVYICRVWMKPSVVSKGYRAHRENEWVCRMISNYEMIMRKCWNGEKGWLNQWLYCGQKPWYWWTPYLECMARPGNRIRGRRITSMVPSR